MSELLLESANFTVFLDIFSVALMTEFLIDFLFTRSLSQEHLGCGALVSKEVAELAFEFNRVVEFGNSYGALKMEPEQRVHDAAVGEDAVLHCFLHHAVDIVFFQRFAFVRALQWRHVKNIHFSIII